MLTLRNILFDEPRKTYDCGLVIGDMDIVCNLVWTPESNITEYGIETFKELLDSPAEYYSDSNCLEIFSDNVELGTHFAFTLAGFTSIDESIKLFGE